jgi:hypothetical protein
MLDYDLEELYEVQLKISIMVKKSITFHRKFMFQLTKEKME